MAPFTVFNSQALGSSKRSERINFYSHARCKSRAYVRCFGPLAKFLRIRSSTIDSRPTDKLRLCICICINDCDQPVWRIRDGEKLLTTCLFVRNAPHCVRCCIFCQSIRCPSEGKKRLWVPTILVFFEDILRYSLILAVYVYARPPPDDARCPFSAHSANKLSMCTFPLFFFTSFHWNHPMLNWIARPLFATNPICNTPKESAELAPIFSEEVPYVCHIYG